MFWDVISFLALILSFSSKTELKFFRIFFIFSYNNFRTLYKNLREQWKTGDLFDLVLLLFRLICVAHFIACFWHAIGYYKLTEFQKSWLDDYLECPWPSRYMISLYWAITTLCTVGYGDIVPKNSLEMFYVSVIMLLGTLIFGYSINCVGTLINRMEERGKELSEKMNMVDTYMNKAHLNENLKIKVKKYLQYIWNTEDKNFEKGEEIINKLPNKIRDEILLESIGKFLKEFPIMQENFSQQLIEKIALTIKPIRYSPCDIIYQVILLFSLNISYILKEGEIGDLSIFFIEQGEIELLINQRENKEKTSEIIIKNLKRGDFLGEMPFFTATPFEETARSRSFSTVFRLLRYEFLEILKEFPQDYVII